MHLQKNRHEILRIAAMHGARNIRLSGSAARGADHQEPRVAGARTNPVIDVDPIRVRASIASARV